MGDAILVGVGTVAGGHMTIDWQPAKWFDVGKQDGSEGKQFLPSLWTSGERAKAEYVQGYIEGAYPNRFMSGYAWNIYNQACQYLDDMTDAIDPTIRAYLLELAIAESGELP